MSDVKPDVRAIFCEALEKQSPAEVANYLDEACGHDAELRAQVEALLGAHGEVGDFLGGGPAPTTDEPISERAGSVIGPYKLLQQIGEGGMGVVYMAEQTKPVERRVALKIIKLGMDTRQVIARFEAERQALAMMDHPNITKVLDAGVTESGRPYFVMELVKGMPITEYCDEQHLTARKRLELFLPVCRAVQHAHQKGIIHRDLKPSNVMVSLYDDRPIPKVIDFGVAKAISQKLTEKTMFTQYGQVVGTLEYMSPEQAKLNQLDIDTRSDVYSLGVLLYELLTGTTPLDKQRLRSSAFEEMLRIIREEEPPKPSTRLRSSATLPAIAANRGTEPRKLSALIHGELDWIVMKSLEKERTRRYETASGLAADVEHYLNDEQVEACPPSAAYRFRKFARRNAAAMTTAAIVATTLLLGTVVSTWQAIRATNAEVVARREQSVAEREAERADRAAEEERIARIGEQRAKEQARMEADRARRFLYAADINLVQHAWDSANVTYARDLLNRHVPAAGEEDLRGFAWHYLWGLCHKEFMIPTFHEASPVWSIDYSPDGRWLAWSAGNEVRLRELGTGNERTFQGHLGEVYTLAFSPDSQTLASGSLDTTVKLWEAATGNLLSTLDGHGDELTCLAFSPDGKTLASASLDATVKLWDLSAGPIAAGGRDPITLELDNAVLSVAFSSDGQSLATGGHDRTVRLWDPTTGQHQATFDDGQSYVVWSVAFSHDAKSLAVGSFEGTVKLWDVATRKVVRRLLTHRTSVRSVAFSPDDTMLASGSADGTVKLCDVKTATELDHITITDQPVPALAFSTNGQTLACAALDKTVRLWDIGKDTLRGHRASVTDLAVSSDGKMLASTSRDDTVRLWSLTTGQILQEFVGYKTDVFVAFSPDDKLLAASGTNNTVVLWDLTVGKELDTFKGHEKTVRFLAFSPKGNILASGSQDQTLRLWDLARRAQTAILEDHQAWGGLAFSPDGETLASVSPGGVVKLWDLSRGASQDVVRVRATLQHARNVSHVAISPDGKTLAACCFQDFTVHLWDLETRQELPTSPLRGSVGAIQALAFSRDSKFVATGGQDDQVRLWRVATGGQFESLRRHHGHLGALVFTPDGKTLISGSHDSTIRLWKLRPVEDLFVVEPPRQPRNEQPPPASSVDVFPVVLQSSPFSHPHAGVSHIASQWQLRMADEPDSMPIVDLVARQNLNSLSIGKKFLLPATTYAWRVKYDASNGKESSWSHETKFTTGDFPMRTVRFDLSNQFSRDVIANAGDDSTDVLVEGSLVVSGFDGLRTDNPDVQGVPSDGVLGIFALDDFSRLNVVQTGSEYKTPIRIQVPRGSYDAIHFLVAGDAPFRGLWRGFGHARMPVRVEYADGTTGAGTILCDHWRLEEDFHPGVARVLGKMDCFQNNEFRDMNSLSLYDYALDVDSDSELVAIVLETHKAIYARPDARFHLFAATGVLAER